jgi:serine phosphatase RsbU (regulator of sigma subunit)
VASQASIALDNASMHEQLLQRVKLDEENKAATKVQLALLPQLTPKIPGYEFFARYLPARTVGGDYYDFIATADGRHVILLGDVAGKGVPAALIVARVSGEAKVCVLTRPSIADAVTRLNELFFEANFEDRYLALAAGVLNPVKHQVTFVNAGNLPPPLIYRHKTRKLEEPVPRAVSGFAIGQFPGFQYESITADLPPHDTIVLCTDGILDARSPADREFGMDGVAKALAIDDPNIILTAAQIGKRIIDAVTLHMGNEPQFDDIAIVCFGRVDSPDADIAPTRSGELEIA